MKALVYHGPGKRAWEEVPDAAIQEPTDAVVRVDAVTICGTDLHILGGDVPEVAVGRILGHEAVGTVTEVGSAVQKLAVGDRVLVSCITSCGSCRYPSGGSRSFDLIIRPRTAEKPSGEAAAGPTGGLFRPGGAGEGPTGRGFHSRACCGAFGSAAERTTWRKGI